MLYGIVRFGLIPLSFIGWLLYQLLKKKKNLAELKSDIIMILIFIAVWVLIFSQFISDEDLFQ